jgi:predicted nucleic acid-binding Zn ribbon protein
MDCPNCGTWNPEDKIKCWRCNTELPRPVEKKPRRRGNVNTWLWIIVLVFVLLVLLQQCFLAGRDPNASSLLPLIAPWA